jgi:hypothetical protein
MSAEEVWDDAQRLAELLRRNLAKANPQSPSRVSLAAVLSALEDLSLDELEILHRQVGQRLREAA